MSTVDIRVEEDPTRLRPSDVPVMICDNRCLLEATGWQPGIELRRTLQDVLNAWRLDIQGNSAAAFGVPG